MEGWYLDCASTSHLYGNQRMFPRYMGLTMNDEREFCDMAGTVAGKAIGQGDIWLRFRLPGCRDGNNEVVVRDVLHVEWAHNLLSWSGLMDRGFQIIPVNSVGIKIYNNATTGHVDLERLVAVAPQVGGQFL